MGQSAFWEVGRRAAVWYRRVHEHIRKVQPLACFRSQVNPLSALPPSFRPIVRRAEGPRFRIKGMKICCLIRAMAPFMAQWWSDDQHGKTQSTRRKPCHSALYSQRISLEVVRDWTRFCALRSRCLAGWAYVTAYMCIFDPRLTDGTSVLETCNSNTWEHNGAYIVRARFLPLYRYFIFFFFYRDAFPTFLKNVCLIRTYCTEQHRKIWNAYTHRVELKPTISMF
jgi:hypothetical protein